jgi:tripartite-type tricarboxylate transporter receptor subunit TctC
MHAVSSYLAWLTIFGVSSPALAEPVGDFYNGKTITMLIGFSAGGDYDLRARLLAPYLTKYVPGHPTVVPQNMVGGAGIVAANWVANVAPRNGTVLFAISSPSPVSQAVKLDGVNFDVRKFNWIGNTSGSQNLINSWHTSGITKIDQTTRQELVIGATARNSGSYYYPMSLNLYAGTKFKIVSGYPGGNDINLAMERGEVLGRGSNSWAAWKSTRPQWIAENKIIPLVQIGIARNKELPDIPLMQDLTDDPVAKKVLRFISLDTLISRAFVTTPGVPPDRVAALRTAFGQSLKDPDLLAEAGRQQMDIEPSTGEEAAEIAREIVETDPAIVEIAKSVLLGKAP